MRDVVIGVDASTTAVKAIAFTRDGAALHEARHAYPLSTPLPGHVEQDPQDWWHALKSAFRDLFQTVEPSRVAGIALTHQRETFCLIDDAGRAVRPAILWLDERARTQVADLSARIGRDRIREWTGKPPDPTPALYALAWLKQHEPEALSNAATLADTGTYLHLKLTGNLTASVASADPLGLVDLRGKSWRPELLSAAGLSEKQLPSLVLPGIEIGRVSADAAAACGLQEGIPVFAAVGDGQANSLGLGVTGQGNACLSLGSGIVFGMYSPHYAHSDAYRTLTAPDGEGYLLETVLRSGMQLIEWVLRSTGGATAPELEAQALQVPPGSEGLMTLPYFSGVMNPWWDDSSRGAMIGLSLSHTPAHLYRSAIEGICFEQAVATDAMERSLGSRAQSVVASGGGTNSRLMMQCLSAIMERPVAISNVGEAAALGAAMLAAIGSGWFETTDEAARSMCAQPSSSVAPDPDLVKIYRPLLDIYRELYPALKPVQTKLASNGASQA
jgi:xylulokinase